jgi:hypothetical protein
MPAKDEILSLWPSIWPAITLLAGFVAKATIDHWAAYRSGKAIEAIKAELQTKLEGVRAELRSRDETVNVLRNSVLQRSDARAIKLVERRIAAVEKLWASVIELDAYVMASKMTAPMKFEVMLQAAARNDEQGAKIREFAERYWAILKIEQTKITVLAEIERPFLSETAWARYTLFRNVVTYPVTMLASIKSGIDPEFIKDPAPLLDAVKTALPHHTDWVDALKHLDGHAQTAGCGPQIDALLHQPGCRCMA